MILCDRDIRARLRAGTVSIVPSRDLEAQLRASSLDLLLGHSFRPLGAGTTTHVSYGASFFLPTGGAVLGETFEELALPADLAARVEGRSTIDRWGLVVQATDPFLDAGFEGKVALEILNLSPVPIRLVPRTRICRITFHMLTSHADLGARRAPGPPNLVPSLGATFGPGAESGVVAICGALTGDDET